MYRAKRIGGWRFKFTALLFCWLPRENEVEEVKNEGPREMTLDEWKAMQDKERTKVEFNIRKPNEGADSQWKKGYVLHKSKSEDVSFLVFDLLFHFSVMEQKHLETCAL